MEGQQHEFWTYFRDGANRISLNTSPSGSILGDWDLRVATSFRSYVTLGKIQLLQVSVSFCRRKNRSLRNWKVNVVRGQGLVQSETSKHNKGPGGRGENFSLYPESTTGNLRKDFSAAKWHARGHICTIPSVKVQLASPPEQGESATVLASV